MRVWDLESDRCLATLEGHTHYVAAVALSADGRRALSGSADKTVRVWDLSPMTVAPAEDKQAARYTNAKVVLVGESGVGKTGLALRLCEDRWEATESTHGMRVSQLKLGPEAGRAGMDREIWVWDFAGQPDYRLVHQLYMDETALGIVVFDPQDDNPFEALGYWEKALHRTGQGQPRQRESGIDPDRSRLRRRGRGGSDFPSHTEL